VLLAVPLTGTIKAALEYFGEISEEAEKKEKLEKEVNQKKSEEKVVPAPKKKSILGGKPKNGDTK
ncbi:MAG: hypothetical protein AB1414_08330, partial [bacterium]